MRSGPSVNHTRTLSLKITDAQLSVPLWRTNTMLPGNTASSSVVSGMNSYRTVCGSPSRALQFTGIKTLNNSPKVGGWPTVYSDRVFALGLPQYFWWLRFSWHIFNLCKANEKYYILIQCAFNSKKLIPYTSSTDINVLCEVKIDHRNPPWFFFFKKEKNNMNWI